MRRKVSLIIILAFIFSLSACQTKYSTKYFYNYYELREAMQATGRLPSYFPEGFEPEVSAHLFEYFALAGKSGYVSFGLKNSSLPEPVEDADYYMTNIGFLFFLPDSMKESEIPGIKHDNYWVEEKTADYFMYFNDFMYTEGAQRMYIFDDEGEEEEKTKVTEPPYSHKRITYYYLQPDGVYGFSFDIDINVENEQTLDKINIEFAAESEAEAKAMFASLEKIVLGQ